MQVSGEDGVDAGLHELHGYRLMVLDDVVGQETVLLVEMGHQVMVHHGNDPLAALARLGGLVDDPLQRLGLDASGIVVGVRTVATGRECVLLIHIAVDADDHQALDGFAAVAQRGGVTL